MEIYHIFQYRLDWAAFAALTVGSAALLRHLVRKRNLFKMRWWKGWAWIALLILAGGVAAEYFGKRERLRLEQTIMAFASTYAREAAYLGETAADAKQLSAESHYLSLLAAAQTWLPRNSVVANIFIWRPRADGSFGNSAGAAMPDRGDSDPLARRGSNYPISEDERRVAKGEASFDPVPFLDQRGEWVRAFQPMIDARGRIEAMLGVDVSAEAWYRAQLEERALVLACFYAVFVLGVTFVYVSRQSVEIAERDRIEAKLRASENRFRLICEAVPKVAVQGYDHERRVIFWNQASAALYGFTRDEAMGRQLEDLIIPLPMRQGVIAAIDTWNKTGVAIPAGELWLQQKNGGPINVFSSHVMQHDRHGQPEMYCVDIEMTERNSALAALTERETNYRTLFGTIPYPMFVYDADTMAFVAVNDATLDQYGFSHGEFLKMTPNDIQTPDAVPCIFAFLKQISFVPSLGGKGSVQWYHRKKNGNTFLAEVIESPEMTWGGRRVRILVAQDVTARWNANCRIAEQSAQLEEQNCKLRLAEQSARKAEQYLRTILANAPIVLWAVDRQGICTLLEGKALGEIGLKPGHGVGLPFALKQLDRALSGESFSAEGGYNGRWFDTRFSPLHDDIGKVAGVVGVSVDITARKEAECLAVSEECAREASQLKSEFLANMSHEIRTPMNGVVGMATLLNHTTLNMEQKEMVGTIESSANVLLTVINDILDLSKIEAGKMRIDPIDFDLRLLVEETLALFIPRAQGKGLELLNDFDPAISTGVCGDAVRIRQVLTNLVGNAIKFCERGEVSVRVRLQQDAGQHLGLRIEVQDTGIGIPAEAQGRLFSAFTQADRTTTRKFGGTGLGLAISKQLIELMGGTIGLTSEVGVGSTFWIELALPCAAAAEKPATISLPAGTRILVVDDNHTSLHILKSMLATGTTVVDTRTDGETALSLSLAQHLKGTPYSVILVDQDMPGITGTQFAEQAKAMRAMKGSRMILLSSQAVLCDDTRLGDGLFDAVLAKPVRRMQLFRSIFRALGCANTATPVLKKDTQPSFPVAKRSLRLLLAEDNVVNQRVARLMLTKMGHRVDHARDGEEALILVAQGQYDAVLMDCEMPLLDGFDATRRLRAQEKESEHIKIIALTANVMAEDRKRCLDSGMDDFLAKPLRIAELIAVFDRCGLR